MIELSADLAEASTEAEREVERAIWPLIDAANVACGGHAGDSVSMREAARTASRLGVILGAHPSYPDRENFGRKSMTISRSELRASLTSQLFALRNIAAEEGLVPQRVKAHGALYNDAHHDRALADVIVEALMAVDAKMAIVASDSSEMAKAAREAGCTVVREAFADRRYRSDGSLVPRSEPGALLSISEAADQAGLLARERPFPFDTLCIHADMAGSVERLRAIRQRLAPFLRITSA
jgi:5-oxoprolinase (ATP-hydrolysing) subunit A